jgi:predicted Zn-dependent peptidase
MYKSSVLDNGLRIITEFMPHTRSVSLAIFVGVGSRYETDEIAGSTHFLEHLLFKGTKSWPSAQAISEAIEGTGGIMNASTDKEMTVYWCKVAEPYFKTSLSVLVDMILNPLLDAREIEKERQVIYEELRMTNDYPSHRVDLLIDEMLWPNQPMGRDVGGSLESVANIKRDDLLNLMENQYGPNNVVVSVAGDVRHEDVVEYLTTSIDTWTYREPWKCSPVHSQQSHPSVRLEYRETEQAHVCLGIPAASMKAPDRYAARLFNTLLGEGMTSRLFQKLREELGLVYDVHSEISHFKDCGSLMIYFGSEPARSLCAVSAIIEELVNVKRSFSEDEIERAKRLIKGRMLLGIEDSQNVAMSYGAQELMYGSVKTIDEIAVAIDCLTLDDINQVASTILQESQLNLAVVGPFKDIRKFEPLMRL